MAKAANLEIMQPQWTFKALNNISQWAKQIFLINCPIHVLLYILIQKAPFLLNTFLHISQDCCLQQCSTLLKRKERKASEKNSNLSVAPQKCGSSCPGHHLISLLGIELDTAPANLMSKVAIKCSSVTGLRVKDLKCSESKLQHWRLILS